VRSGKARKTPITAATASPASEARLGDALAKLYYVARREYRIDLTHRAIRVLQFISHRPAPPRLDEVRVYLGCAPSTASELIKRLQKKGLLIRTRAPSDERAIAIELTDLGRETVAEHTSLDPEKLRTGIAGLTTEERSALIGSLETVADALDRD
jgi:DNA-binding MarR family transcriptional regulator